MAKLLVAPFMIVDCLFKGAAPSLQIVGASFDGDCVVLEIEGPQVPKAALVTAEITVEQVHVLFKAIG